MSEWKEYKLSELCELIGGGTPKTSVAEYWNGNIPWLSVTDFNTGRKYCFDAEKKITEKGLKESSTKILKKGQIIISARGTVGVISMLGNDMAFNQSNYGINAKDDLTSNNFLYYLLKDNIPQFISNSYGAVFDTITKQTFEQITVELPPLPEQTAIAEVLSSLDDKIDLLHRQNKTLEQLAEMLFRQWFVEEAEENWEVDVLDNIIELQRGISYSGSSLGEKGEGLPMHSLNSIDINGSYKYEGIKYYKGDAKGKQLLRPGDLLIINTDITQDNRIIGWPVFVPEEFEHSVSTHHLYSATLKNDRVSKLYLYYLLRHRDYREALANASNGTTVSMLSKEAIGGIQVRIPSKEKRLLFEEQVIAFQKKQTNNQKQIRTLTQLRDTLLPKLMSGEIGVKKMEK